MCNPYVRLCVKSENVYSTGDNNFIVPNEYGN